MIAEKKTVGQDAAGLSLIELVVVLVITSLCVLTLLPVLTSLLSTGHRISEMHQGQLLAQERIDQIWAVWWGENGFNTVVDGLFPPESGLSTGGPIRFDRSVEIQGATFDAETESLTCTGEAHTDESYKCVIVEVHTHAERTLLARRWILLAR